MQAVVDFVKDHLQPAWKAKRVDRDAFRLITRKVAEKVLQAAPREAKSLLQVRLMQVYLLTLLVPWDVIKLSMASCLRMPAAM